MKKIAFLFVALLCGTMSYAQSLPENIDLKKVQAQVKITLDRFCDYIVDVGTSSSLNGMSMAKKREKVKETAKLFYNYREDPRMMTTTGSNGSSSRKPIYQYMNNLLLQAESGTKMREYNINAVDGWVECKAVGKEWRLERELSDGCKLYSREYQYRQSYRIVSINNPDPEMRVGDSWEDDVKTIKVYAIVRPDNKSVVVRLGDVVRSEILDKNRKKTTKGNR